MRIGFLHTSPIHTATFDDLGELRPTFRDSRHRDCVASRDRSPHHDLGELRPAIRDRLVGQADASRLCATRVPVISSPQLAVDAALSTG